MTVIIPVYRVEKFLRQCLDSVVSQTLKNIEVIIVDDGSDDNSANIADEYAQNFGHFSCIHKTNGGLASARSCGMKVASGEYIAFLDSDDWVDDFIYDTLYSIAVENNKPDIIVYRSYNESESYYIPRTGYYNRNDIEKELLPYLMPYFDDDGKPHYLRFSNCMKVYKRSFLIESGVFYHEGILIMEDVLFSFDCIDRAQSYYYCNKEMYHVTVNPNSLSRSHYSKNMTQSMILISEYIREYQHRDTGYDYGENIYSAILYFLENGIRNEMNAPNLIRCFWGVRKILNSEICRWYVQQEKPIIAGWYGKLQRNLSECGAISMIYRMRYKSKCKNMLYRVRNSLLKLNK